MRLRKLLIAASLFAFLITPQAFAQAVTGFTIYDCSVSLTGSSQTLLAKNPNRKYLFIVNNGTAGATAGVNLAGGTATLYNTGTTTLNQNGYFELPPNQQQIYGAITATGTSGQYLQCFEGR